MKSQTFWGLAAAILSMNFRGVVAAPGYFIDDVSCTPDMRLALAAVLDGTFKMVEAGLENSAAATQDTPQEKLINDLFGPGAANGQFSIKPFIEKKFNSLKDLLQNKFTTNDQLQPAVESDNVKIYCDERRLKIRKKNPLQSYDEDVKEVKSTGDCLANVAYAGQSQNSFGQLQICPKLMRRILVDNIKATSQLSPSFWAKMTSNFVTIVGKVLYTPIDRIQLGDKVLLHELTHLKVGELTIDVGKWDGYGWKNCRRLSTVTENRASNGAQANADTWALYGSVSLLIKGKKTVESDTGNIIDIAATAAKRALEAMKSAAGYWMKFVA